MTYLSFFGNDTFVPAAPDPIGELADVIELGAPPELAVPTELIALDEPAEPGAAADEPAELIALDEPAEPGAAADEPAEFIALDEPAELGAAAEEPAELLGA